MSKKRIKDLGKIPKTTAHVHIPFKDMVAGCTAERRFTVHARMHDTQGAIEAARAMVTEREWSALDHKKTMVVWQIGGRPSGV